MGAALQPTQQRGRVATALLPLRLFRLLLLLLCVALPPHATAVGTPCSTAAKLGQAAFESDCTWGAPQAVPAGRATTIELASRPVPSGGAFPVVMLFPNASSSSSSSSNGSAPATGTPQPGVWVMARSPNRCRCTQPLSLHATAVAASTNPLLLRHPTAVAASGQLS
jgi:hypothetical protein